LTNWSTGGGPCEKATGQKEKNLELNPSDRVRPKLNQGEGRVEIRSEQGGTCGCEKEEMNLALDKSFVNLGGHVMRKDN